MGVPDRLPRLISTLIDSSSKPVELAGVERWIREFLDLVEDSAVSPCGGISPGLSALRVQRRCTRVLQARASTRPRMNGFFCWLAPTAVRLDAERRSRQFSGGNLGGTRRGTGLRFTVSSVELCQ